MSASTVCTDIECISVFVGFLGLFLDALGAFVIVSADIGAIESLLADSPRLEKAERLQDAREQLFQDVSIEEGDPGFSEIVDIVKEESGTDLDPIRLTAKAPGTLGGGGNVFAYEGEGIDEPHGGVGSHSLVDGWIIQEIDSLEKARKERIRHAGMWLLLVGFSAQIATYYVLNWVI